MTDFSLSELKKTFEYLEINWTYKELKSLAIKLEETLKLLSQNPHLFQVSEFKNNIRRVIVLKNNTLYYRIVNDVIEIMGQVKKLGRRHIKYYL